MEKKLLVSGDTLVVGVDIAKKKNWGRIYDPLGMDAVKPFYFDNTIEGFRRRVSKILEAKSKTQIGKAVIGMEPTAHYC